MSTAQHSAGLVKLSGTITRYTCRRADASFFFTESDDMNIGVVAVAAALAGVSRPAVSTASYASAEEPADYLEFDLNGQPVKGWVWRSPFRECDVVDVAAEWRGDHYELAAIARPSDGTISLYPHCSRGTARHVKNAIKWWFWGSISFNLSVIAFMTVLFSFSTRPIEMEDMPTYLTGTSTSAIDERRRTGPEPSGPTRSCRHPRTLIFRHRQQGSHGHFRTAPRRAANFGLRFFR
ncbi:putative type VI secretion system effector [Xenophilus aerolatus]|nr:putative type VI secretion system effector [Xenophilus aerolatus]